MGPTTVRRALGRALRNLRLGASKTVADVEASRAVSKATLWRIEAGKRAVDPGEVFKLCRLYGASQTEMDKLVALAERTEGQGWWDDYGVPPWFGMYVDLEASADELLIYDPALVHGLLQTPDYARALFDASGQLQDPDSITRQVEIRRERQDAIARRASPLHITAVFGAGALAQQVGGQGVIARQRQHLLELAQQPHVDIRVVTPEAGAHAAMWTSAFTILSFRDNEDPDVVYLEFLTGARYSEKPEDLDAYRRTFEDCRKVSVPIEESV